MKTLKTLLFTLIAITCYSYSFAQNPGSAKISLDEGKLDKAKEAIDKAMLNEKHTVKAKTWLTRGLIYSTIANTPKELLSKMNVSAENADEIALESFNKALELEPDEKKSDNKETKKAMKEILYPAFLNSAINAYNDARKKDDDESPETKKLYETALAKCKMAAKLNDQDTLVHVIAVTCAYPLKDMETVKNSSESLVKNPNFKGKDFYYQVLAFYYRDTAKDNTKAIEYTKEGLKLAPNDKNMQGLLLDLYIKENKIDEAVADVKRQVDANPTDAEALFRLGILYEKLGKFDEALAAYNKSNDIKPGFDPTYNAGALFFNKGAEILKETNAMALDEYNKKGKAEEARANVEFEKARPYFEKLYIMDATNMQVLGPLSTIYTRLGLKDKAAKISKEIEAIDK